MKKVVYRLILITALSVFVLLFCSAATTKPNLAEPNQQVCKAAPTRPACKADKQEPIAPEQPAFDKENSQLQLAKEQLRGDFYKDSQDSLKWALVIIVTFVVAFIGYAGWRKRQEYRQALADAKEALKETKEACSNAMKYERQAQEKLESIDKLVADKLDEIEKAGNEERQKSTEEAERQLNMNESFFNGQRAFGAKDYETAIEYYKKAEKHLKGDVGYGVYNNWGNALLGLAESKKDPQAEKLLYRAIDKYEKAINIKKDGSEAHNNWGNAFADLAQRKEGLEAEKLFKQAFEKYQEAIEINPDYFEAYKNWDIALCELAKLKKGPKAEVLRRQAEEKRLKAETIKEGLID